MYEDDRIHAAFEAQSPEVGDIFVAEAAALKESYRLHPGLLGPPTQELARRALMATINHEPTAPLWVAWAASATELALFRAMITREFGSMNPE